MRRLSVPAVLWLAVLAAPPAQAVELQLKFGALERMLADSVFTQEGRRYVHGNKGNKCNFAYLEHPDLRGDASGRLNVAARFSGRSALDLFGRCIGMGDRAGPHGARAGHVLAGRASTHRLGHRRRDQGGTGAGQRRRRRVVIDI